MIQETENANHYAIVIDGVVANTVVWDGVTEYDPEGLVVDLTGLDPEPAIGWSYVKGKWVAPVVPDPEPETA